MPLSHDAKRNFSKWMSFLAVFRFIARAITFALTIDKKKWLQSHINASRRLRQISAQSAIDKPLPTDRIDLNLPRAGWLGHSTCWIQWRNFSILTDPIWSRRCSPISFLGPKRLQAVPVSIDNFPRPKLVLISHNHFDHLDLKTLKKLRRISPKTKIFAPKGLGEWLTLQGIPALSVEMGETQQIECGEFKATLTCTPAIHRSQRSLWDRDQTMWSSWVVKIEYKNLSKTFFFAGDTAYDDLIFSEIGRRFSIDLSFLPIGAYEPRILLKSAHVNPEESVSIHKQIGSKLSIACHHSTFMLGDPYEQPIEDLKRALQNQKTSPREFLALEVNQEINW